MRHTNDWLAYLRKLSGEGRDLAVYALRWAHDIRCIRSGVEHRRVGSEAHFDREWLDAGYACRIETNAARSARGISGGGG